MDGEFSRVCLMHKYLLIQKISVIREMTIPIDL